MLLNKDDPSYYEENGVGLTVLDCAMLVLIQLFHNERDEGDHHRHWRQQQEDFNCPENELQVFKYLLDYLKTKRRITSGKEVNKATNLLIQQSTSDKKPLSRWERRNQQVKAKEILDDIDWAVPLDEDILPGDTSKRFLKGVDETLYRVQTEIDNVDTSDGEGDEPEDELLD